MRQFSRAAICGAVFLLVLGLPVPGRGQAVPDAPAPQATPPPAAPAHQTAPAPTPKKPGDPQQSFPFPGQDDGAHAPPSAGGNTGAPQEPQPANPAGKDFPFPDDKDSPVPANPTNGAGSVPSDTNAPPMNPGFSSSASLHDEGSYGVDVPVNPKRVKQDQSVARYYWNLKDWEGAYLRYKDALRFGPDNPDTLYGLAEAEAKLGKNISARQHYEQYLKVAPGGSKARDVAKAITNLPEKDAPAKKGMGPVIP